MKIPVSVCQRIAEEFGATEVIVIARVPRVKESIKVTTYGITPEACGFAAMAGAQLGAVLQHQPRSLRDALAIASRVRPENVEVTAIKEESDG